ncbi:hypothetical protein TrVE_jg2350 [Triparma verrucosa]|uniref:Uncharacterized protein n=1 Tax=Triparma verrucosa TaxID=1606542 RepID=A0A9W7FEM1_9STRA|nr:hypothetical protein TrVE_jg2350 [Triparma verrucosa]
MSSDISPPATPPRSALNVDEDAGHQPEQGVLQSLNSPALKTAESSNEGARISSFSMSDGPIRVSLNIYDGKELKDVVRDLIHVVKEQAATIESYSSRFSELESLVYSESMRNKTRVDALSNGVNNLAQNIQGFVDKDVEEVETVIAAAPTIMETISVRANPLPSPAVSPEKEEIFVEEEEKKEVKPEPELEPEPEPEPEPEVKPEPVAAPAPAPKPVNIPAPAPAPTPTPAPAPAPTPAPAPAPAPAVTPAPASTPAPAPVTTTTNTTRSSVSSNSPPKPKPNNRQARLRFQRAVRKVILQIRMKDSMVGVLTSRAKKGQSIGERLQTNEEMRWKQETAIELLKKQLADQKVEIEKLRLERGEWMAKVEEKFTGQDEILQEVKAEVDELGHVAGKMKDLEAAQAAMLEEVKEEVAATTKGLETKTETLSSKLFGYQDSQAEIMVGHGDMHVQNIEQCLARCELLAEEMLKADNLTSDQVFNLRREMGSLDGQSKTAGHFLSIISKYMDVDPKNYGGLKSARTNLSDGVSALEERLGPLWGVVGQFDNNIAQSINLIMTLQTGFSNQEAALKKMEGEILAKADAGIVKSLEDNAKVLEENSKKIKDDMNKVSGDMHNLSSNNADLSTKVYDLYDRMDNIVDEEKLKESVKSLLDLYIRQLNAKAEGNEKLVGELQKELEKNGAAVNDLFRTKADVSEVGQKADNSQVDETKAMLSQLQTFVKQFERELEQVRNGQADDLDKIKRKMERRMTKAMMGQPEKKDDEVLLSHKKLDLCLACNRPMGKSVNLSAAVGYYGPVQDPTKQVFGARRKSTMPANMLIHLEENRRRATSIGGALLPKNRPTGLFSGGFNLPIKKGIWNEDLGGTGDRKAPEPPHTEVQKVRKTLAGMNIDPDGAPDTPSMRKGSMTGKKVPKDWLKVTSKGVTADGGPAAVGNMEALKREARKSSIRAADGRRVRGSSLHVVKSPKAGSTPKTGQQQGSFGVNPSFKESASTTKLPAIG